MDVEILQKVKRGHVDVSGLEWDSLSDAAKDLIGNLLVADLEYRLTVEQAMRHPWFADVCPHVLADHASRASRIHCQRPPSPVEAAVLCEDPAAFDTSRTSNAHPQGTPDAGVACDKRVVACDGPETPGCSGTDHVSTDGSVLRFVRSAELDGRFCTTPGASNRDRCKLACMLQQPIRVVTDEEGCCVADTSELVQQ